MVTKRCCKHFILICVFIGFGCTESKRDNLFDPANSPFIVMQQKPVYDVSTKGVVFSWQYYGRMVQSYRVTRRNLRFNEIKEWEFITPPELINDPLSIDYDAQPVETFVDDSPVFAGESYFYEIEIKDAVANTHQLMGTVQIPGFPIQEILLDLINASAQVKVGFAAEPPVSYEIIRRAEGESDVRVFQTDDPTISQYEDVRLVGNKLYYYSIRSTMADGNVFESAPLKRAFFYQDLEWTVSTEPGAYLYFVAMPEEPVIHFLSTASTSGHVLVVKYNNTIWTDWRPLSHPQNICPDNLVLEIYKTLTSSPHPSSNGGNVTETTFYYYVASVVNSEVYLAAYDFRDFTTPILRALEPWSVSEHARIAFEVLDRVVYVVANNDLRVFTPELGKLGQIDLGLFASVSDFSVDTEGCLWAILSDERRILKSPPVAALDLHNFSSSQWSEIVLPTNTNPLAITSDQGKLFFVLDAENKRVLVYKSDGELFYTFMGLEGLDFHRDGKLRGDILVLGIPSGGAAGEWSEKVYVMDAWGKVRRFDTMFLDESDPYP